MRPLMDDTATFTLIAWLDPTIKYAWEGVTTAAVTAGLGGPSPARYFAASGMEVPAEPLPVLGLPRQVHHHPDSQP